jgi:hypothetical protein
LERKSIHLSPRNPRRTGHAILKSVFTILPTFALIFAFVDFGFLLFRWATLQNGVREGCRYAITFQTATGSGQDASIEAVVQQYAMNIVGTDGQSPAHFRKVLLGHEFEYADCGRWPLGAGIESQTHSRPVSEKG